MVKVKILEPVSGIGDKFNGLSGGFSFAPGSTVEIPAGLAESWAAAGRCEIVTEPAAPPPAATPAPNPAPAAETPKPEPAKEFHATEHPPATEQPAK